MIHICEFNTFEYKWRILHAENRWMFISCVFLTILTMAYFNTLFHHHLHAHHIIIIIKDRCSFSHFTGIVSPYFNFLTVSATDEDAKGNNNNIYVILQLILIMRTLGKMMGRGGQYCKLRLIIYQQLRLTMRVSV